MSKFEDLKNPMCSGNIMLEPRLQEYLKKRTYYKTNNIEPSVPLEMEFMITDSDLNRIRCFLKGDKQIYETNRQGDFFDSNECVGYDDSKKFNFFPSRELFKEDPHYKLQQKKMARDKQAMEQRHNYENYQFMKPLDSNRMNIYNNQISYDNSTLLGSQNSNNFKDSFDIPKFLDDGFEMESKYKQNPNLFKNTDTRKYNNPPNTQYRQRVPTLRDNKIDDKDCIPHNNNLNNIIGNLDTYTNSVSMNYQGSNEMDYDNKMVMPNMNSGGRKYINTAGYQSIPLMAKDGLRDIEMENLMKKLPSKDTKKKSYGYSNPAEHYFDYITEDMQQPDHVVLPFPRGGSATRQTNKTASRPYKRDIY